MSMATTICEACSKRAAKLHNLSGAHVCTGCARDLGEAFGNGPETMRSPVGMPLGAGSNRRPPVEVEFVDDESPDTEWDPTLDPMACPGCGSLPGDGVTDGCDDPMGCGFHKQGMHDAIADTQRSHVKHESDKFDGDSYMEETLRLEEARKRQTNAPVNAESVGHVRQLRTQELPANRIRIGK